MLPHLGYCLCSAFQARIPRFTLIRVLDISLLQHSTFNLSENCWVYLQNISTSNHPSPLPLLPLYCQPLACHLDYWSHFLTGLPACAPVLGTAAWVILYKWKSDHVTAQNPPMASHLTKWKSTTGKGMIWLPCNFSDLSAPLPPPLSTPAARASGFY